ncbi:DUF1657 domain-containing protein [Priestia abyssalis]|uniref:DUF1657 domain-containing protein n=1 Tax=Priestia abyssalis TaxID=1221450 RepID=UPI0009956336|nr:DUF1657 domain-containing protein [Priestia abyssalis]
MTLFLQVKQCFVNAKNIHAMLQEYALQVTEEEVQSVFREAVTETEEVVEELRKQLQELEHELTNGSRFH